MVRILGSRGITAAAVAALLIVWQWSPGDVEAQQAEGDEPKAPLQAELPAPEKAEDPAEKDTAEKSDAKPEEPAGASEPRETRPDADSQRDNEGRRAALGVRIQGNREGVWIMSVYRASPAAQAGLRSGDRLLQINGKPYQTPEEAAAAIRELQPGETAELRVERNGREETYTVELAAASDIFQPQDRFQPRPLTPREAFRPNFQGAELQQMQEEIEALRNEVAALHSQLNGMKRQLESTTSKDEPDKTTPDAPQP